MSENKAMAVLAIVVITLLGCALAGLLIVTERENIRYHELQKMRLAVDCYRKPDGFWIKNSEVKKLLGVE